MGVHLTSAPARKSADSRDTLVAAENARKAQNVNAALSAFSGPAQKADDRPKVRSSNGISQIVAGIYGDQPARPAVAQKASAEPFHRRMKDIGERLPESAGRLLDLVVRADEAHRGAQLIDVSITAVALALGVPREEAEVARDTLVRAGLLTYRDNGSGESGYRLSI